MRIVYVTSSLPYGPGETFIVPEIEELRRRGHEILIVPMWPRGPIVHEGARRLLANTHALPIISPAIVAAAALVTIRKPLATLKAVATLRHSRSPAVLGKNLAILAKALWLAKSATAWEAGHIHAHWAATTATMGQIASSVSGIPWSVTSHRWDIAENNLLGVKARSAAFVRAINRQGADRLAALANTKGFHPAVIHIGVPLEISQRPAVSAGDGHSCRILTPANLLPVKGHHYLIEAMDILRHRKVDVYLDIAGDGPLRGDLEAQSARLQLQDRIRFLGQLPHDDLIARMAKRDWDIVVLPSITTDRGEHEGTPVALMEAMAFGMPVISTQTGGIGELLEKHAGSLVPERDPSALADAIQQLARDPGRRRALGAAGRRRVEESFSIANVVTELEGRFAGA